MLKYLCTACLIFVAACGSGNSLDGSIEESFSLKFDRVEIRKQGYDLIIEYLYDRKEGGTDRVVQVFFDTEDIDGLGSGTFIDAETFLERVVVKRVTKDPGEFPEVLDGRIEFDTFQFENDGRVSGEFVVTFDGGTGLRGRFDAKVEEVDPEA